MEAVLVVAVAFVASGLTLFSGFGLGTLLLPAFALLWPAEVALGATAVVHLANNVFKLALVGRAAAWAVVGRFGLPALAGAVAGAALLVALAEAPALFTYTTFGVPHTVRALPLVLGLLIVGFAVLETRPAFARLAVPTRFLPWGGLASGFLGGLSGLQGALRSAFLLKTGLEPAAFIATGAVIAAGVDGARLLVYGLAHATTPFAPLPADAWPLVGLATAAAFLGAVVGARLIPKLTVGAVRAGVALALGLMGSAMAAGLI
ncbi:TSUP family transporter [Pararhodospirillum oryzae]|uniref:Probable membrane transporter protein n=1 Tax=Pararhodospirillum oryzae TaxID=478448 RepID=A0A512HBW7_9PROT|nr:TSUP family transporter [Pararhodospirillum oryzae]GEO82941.1 hypothetical protein ROR02_30720 [Pararhodospirillum oryzae]